MLELKYFEDQNQPYIRYTEGLKCYFLYWFHLEQRGSLIKEFFQWQEHTIGFSKLSGTSEPFRGTSLNNDILSLLDIVHKVDFVVSKIS